MTTKSPDLNPDRIISKFTPLVYYFARQYTRYGLSLEDLVQEGMLGLLDACGRFDSSRDIKFETYAGYWIKKYILQAVGKESKHSFHNSELDENTLPESSASQENEGKEQLTLPLSMPDLEKKILRLSFEQGKTLKGIASELDQTPEKIRQMRDKALRRLRKSPPSSTKTKV